MTANESYTCDAANRLTSKTVSGSTSTVTSDANGNTLTDGVRTNTWDSQNRLVQCVANGTTSAFTYGSDGLRRRGVVTASDGTKTRTDYVYDASMMVEQIVQHFDASGDALDTPTTVSYLQGPQGPLYRKSSAEANPSWYVYDGLGSVVGEVDVNGNLTATKAFDVYGSTRNYTGNPTTRQGFVRQLGHETDDETGLVYMRARYYDPETGRFVSEDPSQQGVNWFSYCDNNPVNFSDETGRYKMSWGAKADWFTAGNIAMGVAMFILFTTTKFTKLSEVAMFASIEIAMYCYSNAATGMPDGHSVGMSTLGGIAGMTGALTLLAEESAWVTRTEAGVAVACLLTEAVVESGFLASMDSDTGSNSEQL